MFRLPSRIGWSGLDGLCLVLRRLSYPNRLFDLVPIFGRSVQELIVILMTTTPSDAGVRKRPKRGHRTHQTTVSELAWGGCWEAVDSGGLPQLGEYPPHPHQPRHRKSHISSTTAHTWLHALGFKHKTAKRGVFVDIHDKADVVEFRNHTFLPKMAQVERRSFRFVIVRDEDTEAVHYKPVNGFRWGSGRRLLSG